MPSTILFLRPSNDLPTRYASQYLEEAVNEARRLNHNVIDLKDELVTRENFTNYMMNSHPDIVVLTGHGFPEMIAGWGNLPILKAGVDDAILEGRTIIALSCSAGKELGKVLVERGAKAFLGFQRPFTFYFESKSNPTSDEKARLFFKPAIEATLALLKGESIQKAYNLAIDSYNESMMKASEMYLPGYMVEDLKDNRDNLVAYAREADVWMPLITATAIPGMPPL